MSLAALPGSLIINSSSDLLGGRAAEVINKRSQLR
jgi:hypothetical protein